MRHGQLVALPGYGRKGVALKITARDLRTTGVLVTLPGVYVFSGLWYGTNPLDFRNYGKIHGKQGRVVGRFRAVPYIRKRLV